jgi:hypothetical protein
MLENLSDSLNNAGFDIAHIGNAQELSSALDTLGIELLSKRLLWKRPRVERHGREDSEGRLRRTHHPPQGPLSETSKCK